MHRDEPPNAQFQVIRSSRLPRTQLSERGDTQVGQLRLAVQRRRARTARTAARTSSTSTVFGRQAETCAEYLAKGRRIAVEGRLHHDEWDGRERPPPPEARGHRRTASSSSTRASPRATPSPSRPSRPRRRRRGLGRAPGHRPPASAAPERERHATGHVDHRGRARPGRHPLDRPGAPPPPRRGHPYRRREARAPAAGAGIDTAAAERPRSHRATRVRLRANDAMTTAATRKARKAARSERAIRHARAAKARRRPRPFRGHPRGARPPTREGCRCPITPDSTLRDLVALGAGCTAGRWVCPTLDGIRRRLGA